MKNLLFLLIVLPSFVFAQSYEEQEMAMSNGLQNGFMVTIEGLKDKDVVSIWEKYSKDVLGEKAKRDRKSDEYRTMDANIDALSETTTNVYAKIADKGDKLVGVKVWFNLGGAYLNSTAHQDKMKFVEDMSNFLVVQGEMEKTRQMIKAEEKTLSNLNGDMKNLKKEKSNFEKDIEKAKEAIKNAEAGIAANIESQANKTVEIDEQKARVEELKSELGKLGDRF